MSLTRKEFFRQAFLSLGKTAVEVADTLQGISAPAPREEPAAEPPEDEFPPPPKPDEDQVASAENGRCLARSCGCFSCIERCEPEAIAVVPGVGISIDESRCTGCGTCEYVCPVFPKAIRMVAREREAASEPATGTVS